MTMRDRGSGYRIEDEVSASIQRLRAQAYGSGALRSTPQQQIEVQQTGGEPIYVIQPVNRQVVYVPQYNPTVVYAGSGLNAGLITFGIGIGITALLVSQPWGWGGWGWNWGARRIYYNRGPRGDWHGGYRPPNPWYRPCPVPYTTVQVWGQLGLPATELPAAGHLFASRFIRGEEHGPGITARSISRVIVLLRTELADDSAGEAGYEGPSSAAKQAARQSAGRPDRLPTT